MVLYSNRTIKYPTAKKALEILRVYGRYAPDIIADAMMDMERIKKEGDLDGSAS